MKRYYRWVRPDANGRITGRALASSQPSPEWVALVDWRDSDAVNEDPRPFRVTAEGRLERLQRVRLSAARRRIPADGATTAPLLVRGAERLALPEGYEEVEVTVNGAPVRLRAGIVYKIGPATEPGTWDVRLTDPRVWADEDRFRVEAYAAGGEV